MDNQLLDDAPLSETEAATINEGAIGRTARMVGMTSEEMLNHVMTGRCSLFLDEQRTTDTISLPPLTCGFQSVTGPAEVLVVGSMPSVEESTSGLPHDSDAGRQWLRHLKSMDVDATTWATAWVVPYFVPGYLAGNGAVKAVYRHDGAPLLEAVFQLTAPKVVVCLGADAFKAAQAITGLGKHINFKDARGVILESPSGVRVVAVIPPSRLLKAPELIDEFEQDTELVVEAVTGRRIAPTWEEPDVTVVSTLDGLTELVADLSHFTLFAIDLEWGGGEVLRTAQLAWGGNRAAVLVFAHAGMKPTELGDNKPLAMGMLGVLLQRPDVGLIGHNLRGDIRVLRRHGLDLLPQFLNTDAGGFDTMLGHHLLHELSEQNLKMVAMKVLRTPRYDKPLRDWLTSNKISVATLDERGYGDVPDAILIPYSAWDAVVSFHLREKLVKRLKTQGRLWELYSQGVHPVNAALLEMEENGVLIDRDMLRKLSDLFSVKRAHLRESLQKQLNWGDTTDVVFKPKILSTLTAVWAPLKEEFRTLGVRRGDVDKDVRQWLEWFAQDPRCVARWRDMLTDAYTVGGELLPLMPESAVLESGQTLVKAKRLFLQEAAAFLAEMPVAGYNPDSPQQTLEMLFGVFKDRDPSKRRSPASATILNLTPVKATDDTVWGAVVESGREHVYTPSSDGESLDILSTRHNIPFLDTLKRYRTVAQMSKTFITPYTVGPTGEAVWPRGSGLGGYIDEDGRARTSYNQAVETGRYSTRPNNQNFPKAKEADIRQVFVDDGKLDPNYQPMRRVILPSPGMVLVEGDWNQAELWTLGFLSKDDLLLNILATSDLHTEVLLQCFGDVLFEDRPIKELSVATINHLRDTDRGLQLNNLRTAAKTVNFGIPYARGGAALSREISQKGIECSVDTGRKMVVDWHNKFRDASAFLERCKEAVTDPGYVETAFGRRRHFPETEDHDLLHAMQREACNAPIQGTVGDAMTMCLKEFQRLRQEKGCPFFRLLMTIHDAVLLETAPKDVPYVVKELFPSAMEKGVTIPGTGGKCFTLGRPEIMLRWGEHTSPEALEAVGVPRDMCGYR